MCLKIARAMQFAFQWQKYIITIEFRFMSIYATKNGLMAIKSLQFTVTFRVYGRGNWCAYFLSLVKSRLSVLFFFSHFATENKTAYAPKYPQIISLFLGSNGALYIVY